MNQARLGENESLFRDINEALEVEAGPFQPADSRFSFLCECDDLDCVEHVLLTHREYEELRSDPQQFVVVPGHLDPAPEHVVVVEAEGYLVVRKLGEAGAVARELDPRS